MAKQPTKTKKKTMHQALPFASFMGLRADTPDDDSDAKRAEQDEQWAKKAETNPDREQLEDESDEDYATRMEQMDDEEQAKAEGEIETEPDAEDESDDEKAKAVRQSERVRCARIIAHGLKSGNVNQAAVLAFDTGLSASQAISTMNASKADQKIGGLGGRMAGVTNHNIGGSAGAGKQFQNRDEATASSILDSVNAARN